MAVQLKSATGIKNEANKKVTSIGHSTRSRPKNNPINANSFNNYGHKITQDLQCLIIFVFRSNLVKSEGFVHFTREYITSQ